MKIENLIVTAKNVIGVNVRINISYSISKTLPVSAGPYELSQGQMLPINELAGNITVKVENDDYAYEVVEIIIPQDKKLRWNNRNADVKLDGNDIVIDIILIRLKHANIVMIPKELAEQIKNNPDKAVSAPPKPFNISEEELTSGVWNEPAMKEKTYWGLEHFYRPIKIRTIKNENNVPIKDAKPDGWERFHFEDAEVKLSDHGGFLWLEYGAVDSYISSKPKFLLGLWVPVPTQKNRPLDFIVNFGHSPTAWSFTGTKFPYKNYLYSINTKDSFTPGHPQLYIHFGQSYFFETHNFGFHIAAQSVASKKPCIIVMPLMPNDPSGVGQPFISAPGIYRLLLEIKQFLFKKGYSENGTFDFSGWQGRTADIGRINSPLLSEKFFFDKLPVKMETGKVVTAAHSSGLQFLLSLLNNTGLNKSYTQDLFGADEKEFSNLWKECWDLDLAHFKAPSVETYLNALLKWFKQGNKIIRIYRSEHTFSDISSFDRIGKIAANKTVKSDKTAQAQYWFSQNEDVTFLFINNGYSSSNTPLPDIKPSFLTPGDPWWRFHQFPMILGFGHASKLRAGSP